MGAGGWLYCSRMPYTLSLEQGLAQAGDANELQEKENS